VSLVMMDLDQDTISLNSRLWSLL